MWLGQTGMALPECLTPETFATQLHYNVDHVWGPSGIEMAAVFQHGENDHSNNDQWGPFDIEDSMIADDIANRDDFQPEMVEVTVEPLPGNSYFIVRQGPSTSTKEVDRISRGEKPQVILAVTSEVYWVANTDEGTPSPELKRWIPVHIPQKPTDGYIREDVAVIKRPQRDPPASTCPSGRLRASVQGSPGGSIPTERGQRRAAPATPGRAAAHTGYPGSV